MFGRVIEVTPEGRTVWQFHNPHRAGKDGEFIATICRMRRLPEDAAFAWLPQEPRARPRPVAGD